MSATGGRNDYAAPLHHFCRYDHLDLGSREPVRSLFERPGVLFEIGGQGVAYLLSASGPGGIESA
jgi:hypothetical protein